MGASTSAAAGVATMAESTADALLTARDLEVSYGRVQALWAISFSVRAGQVTSVIGSNGAGKTTTLNAIAGVLPVQAGRLLFRGDDITTLSSAGRVKRRISLVPEGRQLWPRMTVEDNLLMGCYASDQRRTARDRLGRAYTLFPRLAERRHQLAGTLSGGEQQMCAIGRGLMSDPQLLMLDEPSLGLAPILVDEIFQHIVEIAGQGVTIFLVGQNVNYTLQVSGYVYVMDLGRITLEGRPEQLRANDHVRQAYLGGR
jgi:branched-chain amino acid transport system ATP-binding protein